MHNQKRQSFLHGAMILTLATLVVKVIGMLYRIPLGNILGAGGMSHFMSAYSIFNPIYALSVSGLPVAVSKLVSENEALGRYRDVRRIRRVSLVLFLCTGLGGMLVMLLGAGGFARLIGNPDASLAIAAIAPAIFFCCILSSFRGYHQGLHNMTPTAVSQVVESVAKLVCGIAFSSIILSRGIQQYHQTGAVFGRTAESLGQAQLLVLPYAAAGAILGVTASTAVGALYLFLRHLAKGDGLEKAKIKASPAPQPRGILTRRLVRIALPVCLTAAVAHISTLIDVATIMNRVGTAIERDSAAVLAGYAHLLPADLTEDMVPSFLYGAYTYTTSLFNLIPALTATLGISVLPVIASDWAVNRKDKAAEQVRSVIKLSALVAIPAGLGLTALAGPILSLLYPSLTAEVAIATPLLQRMGIAAVLVGITTPLMSVFQAVGKADYPVWLMLGGALLKLGVNYTLLAVPSLNIGAAPLGTVVCYAFIFTAGLVLMQGKLKLEIAVGKTLLRPLFCGIICAVAANTSYNLICRVWNSRAVVLLSIVVGAGFYAIFILFLKIITKKEALMLPNGKKIVKILEKLNFLG